MNNNEDELKDIEGYEGIYAVTKDGRIWRHGRWLSPHDSKKNVYPQIALTKDKKQTRFTVHRLVASEFIDNPENKPFVNHKNGVKTDNRVENLEWVTPLENIRHAFKTGLMHGPRGVRQHLAKLTEGDVKDIRMFYAGGVKQHAIARVYNMDQSTISVLVNKKTWRDIDD